MLGHSRQILHVFQRSGNALKASDVGPARRHIAHYWSNLKRFNPKQDATLIALPKPYIVPAYEEGREFDFPEMYYWDTYFIAQGMLDLEHKELVLGMLENLLFLFERFHIIPNASRTYLMGRSQPPFLTSYIFDCYEHFGLKPKWLAAKMHVAREEYETVWLGAAKPHARRVYAGLSRYYDINQLHDLAEAESGWDMTTRFGRHALNYLPVDLNSLLYKYEMDFANTARILGDAHGEAAWHRLAEERKQTMNHLMWDRVQKTFCDYNYVKKTRSHVNSLASYYTMWAGLATDAQAAQLVKNLRRFEHKGGLAATELPNISHLPGTMPTQWAHPNGWAPLHYIVVQGLLRYGYEADARRIAMKWLRTNLDWYNHHGNFLEKYNVVQPTKPPVKGVYPTLIGFGWTNAVFERFCRDFIDSAKKN